MENNKVCRLCFKIKKQLINIFNNKDFKLNIAEILTKHFWFEVNGTIINQIIFSNFYISISIPISYMNNIYNFLGI